MSWVSEDEEPNQPPEETPSVVALVTQIAFKAVCQGNSFNKKSHRKLGRGIHADFEREIGNYVHDPTDESDEDNRERASRIDFDDFPRVLDARKTNLTYLKIALSARRKAYLDTSKHPECFNSSNQEVNDPRDCIRNFHSACFCRRSNITEGLNSPDQGPDTARESDSPYDDLRKGKKGSNVGVGG